MSICHLCLRTDRKVHVVDENLADFLDELCEFATVEQTESCAECAWILKKFYDIREKWILAMNILKKWKKKKHPDKIPMNLLYTVLPQSGLGFSNIQNCKVFTYNEADMVTVNVAPTNPCIIIDPSKLGVFSNNSINNTDIFDDEILGIRETENDIKNEITQYEDESKCESGKYGEDKEIAQISEEFDMLVEDCDSMVKDDDVVKLTDDAELTDDEEFTEDAEYLDLELLHDAELKDTGLLGLQDDNVTINIENCDSTNDDTKPIQTLNDFEDQNNYPDIQKCPKSATNCNEKKYIKAMKQFKNIFKPEYMEIEKIRTEITRKIKIMKAAKTVVPPLLQSKIRFLRDTLKRKFAKNPELKDKKGNVIDKKVILDCLDKLPLDSLKQITRSVLDPNTFDSVDIILFSKLQLRYATEYESVFTSEVLWTDEQVLKEFCKRQYNADYIGSKYKCTTCYRGFKYEKMLEYHLRAYHNASAPLECWLCKMRFRKKVDWSKHKNNHKLVLKCKLCPFYTSYWSSMLNHYNFHQGVNYICKICKKTYRSLSTLKMHRQYSHSSEAFSCELCGRRFVSEMGLAQHERLKHKNEVTDPADSVKCQTCDMTFVSKKMLELHMRKTHGVRKSRAGCGAGVPKKPLVCRLCQSVGPNVGWLNKHFRYEHPNISVEEAYWMGKKYLCHICGKTFANITKLNDHKVLHTGAKLHSCPRCPRSFHCTDALKRHLEVHLPKARQCEVCGKKFRSLSNLNSHRRIHYDERIYKCDKCPAKFLMKCSLKEHVLGVHQNIRRVRVKPGKRKILLEATRVNTETENESE